MNTTDQRICAPENNENNLAQLPTKTSKTASGTTLERRRRSANKEQIHAMVGLMICSNLNIQGSFLKKWSLIVFFARITVISVMYFVDVITKKRGIGELELT